MIDAYKRPFIAVTLTLIVWIVFSISAAMLQRNLIVELKEERRNLLEECEKDLPRNINCKLSAIPEER